MEKTYDHNKYEDKIYSLWEKSGLFNPDKIKRKTNGTFSIVLPPPNVTGTLHLGHAEMLAVEDILVRYNRMLGRKTVWIPGTDSAAIATQSKVEGIIYKKEGKSRHDLGREELIKRINNFAKDSESTIINQVKKMGSSLDWSRYAYTLDKKRYSAVIEAFVRMYEAGLIYRGNRIVNWDPEFQTTVADDEIEYKEQKDPFYYFKYGPFIIGTVRPETKFGDKYVVVHPEDKRYKNFKHGQKVDLEWINGPITATVIKDEVVDPSEGSGAMTITPSHSFVDFELAQKYNLDVEQIIDERGFLLPIAGEFAGMHIKKARPLIVEKLKQKGLLERTDEDYVHKISVNYRGGGVIEPQIKLQWWVDVNKKIPQRNGKSLRELMRDCVRNGEIKITPKRFERVYYHWIDNLHDWCISRQIWFGHRIPVWYKDNKTFVGVKPPNEPGWEQDPDTLDTWFSSGLWTFSTLGWPENTKDLKEFHPTSLLETGYDILFFWVARMILMSEFLLGEIPFKNVYLHGLVRDNQGRKMSKSLGNIIDPLTMIEKYGADAVRMSLITGTAPGNDIKLSEDKIRGFRNFSNKIWNASRFLQILMTDNIKKTETKQVKISKKDNDNFKKHLAHVVEKTSKYLNDFKIGQASEYLYREFWHWYCDICIESAKTGEIEKIKMLEGLGTFLKLLHPFIPFVTEAVWLEIKKNKFSQKGFNRIFDSPTLIESLWPK